MRIGVNRVNAGPCQELKHEDRSSPDLCCLERGCPYKYRLLKKLAQLQIIDYASRRL